VSLIFVSHSSRDTEQAARLLTWLRTNGFVETFLDFDKHAGLAPGSDWERSLYREMTAAEAVILILTKNWFDSKWCFAEFTQARALGKAIFPLVEAPTGETFVSSDIQHLDLLKDREGGLEKLAEQLTELVLNARGGFHWDNIRPPYPGLLAFDEADAAIYFGRDDDIRRLIERLNARRAQGGARLVAVLGASGSGKSSLLRAGVLPRLKRDTRNWIALPPFRPQLHPLEELAQSIAIALGSPSDWRHWRDAFLGGDFVNALSDLARDLRGTHGANEAQILITIDQAEELFGAAEKAEAEKFLRVINELQDERLPFLVVMALRSDYLGHLQQAPGLTVPFEDFPLKPMPLARVRDIIEGPARVAGLTVDDALVTAAMNDAATDDALPLLAFALRELYDRFGQSRHLTVQAYSALGDAATQLSPLENAVRRKADEVLSAAKPSPDDLQALKEAFVPAMVRVNTEGEYVRRPARFDALPAKARPLIERLAKARLLIIQMEGDATIVEVAHEALLRKWPLLRGWLDEEREFLIGKDQLEQDLRDWEKTPVDHKTEALLSGLKLTRAQTWLLEKPQQLSETERNFIQASIAHRDAEAAKRERSRRRALQGSVTAALVLAIALAGAIWQWRIAKVQQAMSESRELAALSQDVLRVGNFEEALRLAMLGMEQRPTDEADYAKKGILRGSPSILFLSSGGPISNAAFSPNGKRIVTASDDQTARVWEAETGHLLAILTGHTGPVNDAEFSPDGGRIVTASDDNTGRVWDAESGRLLATLTGHFGNVRHAAFSPDGERIVTASFDRTARVWDAETGQQLATLTGHASSVDYASFSPDGKRIVTASRDKTAGIWDAESGHQLATLTGHTDSVVRAVFSPNGKCIVTASRDKTARTWDAGTGQALATLTGHGDTVNDAAFSPDGENIVTASSDNTARVWDVETGHLLVTLTGEGSVFVATFSPDGNRIVMAGVDGTARVRDAETGHILKTLTGHTDGVFDAAFSPKGNRVVTAGLDHTARVWDSASGHLLAILNGHSDAVVDAAFSPDGKRIVTSSWDHTARVWDAESGHPLATLKGHSHDVWHAVFSPDGNRIVTSTTVDEARVWDSESGHLLKILKPSMVINAAFSPDGKRIVTASGNRIANVSDVETGQIRATLTGHADVVWHAAFSPDGKRIVTASKDNTARVWDAESGKQLGSLTGHSGWVYDAEFSPDGKRIVTASKDHTARLWDAETGHLLATLAGHTGEVFDAAFSPDGKCVVTASFDNTARVWDAESGQLLATLAGHTGSVFEASFSPDGNFIVTASGDGMARIYIADRNDLLNWAKNHVPIESGK
jgi:WD40 repeat protein